MRITIYTDGSCIGNPGPGAWAAIILMEGIEHIIKGADRDTTNNRMEMMAIIEALNWVRANHGEKELSEIMVDLYSDSNLIISTLNLGWKRKANTDLWERMDMARAWISVNWHWVKAHDKDLVNNRVDEIAQKEARRIIRK